MTSQTPAISIRNLSKTFYIQENTQNSIMEKVINFFRSNQSRAIKALEDINLEIYPGEFVGIVGHNGSGKSTLLKLLTSAFPPDKGGSIIVNGQVIRLSLGMGFDGNLTARENIYVNGSILGLSFKEIGNKFEEILDFAGLQNFVDTQIKYYSSGMVSRLAFAIAIHVNADIFLFDEFFGGVGDVDFRRKSEAAFSNTFLEGKTIIFVSHELHQIEQYCDKVILLHKGKLLACGKPDEILEQYKALYD